MSSTAKVNRLVLDTENQATDLSQFRFPSQSSGSKDRNGAFAFNVTGDLWTASDAGWKPHDEVTGLILETDTYPSTIYKGLQFYGKVAYSHNVPYTSINTATGSVAALADVKYGTDPKIPAETGVYLVSATFTYQGGTYTASTALGVDLTVTGAYTRTVRHFVVPENNDSPITISATIIYANTTAAAAPVTIALDQTPTSNNCVCRVGVIKVSELDSNEISSTI